MTDKVTIKIPRELYEKLREMMEGTGFSSVTEFIVFVMRSLASSGKIKEKIDSETGEVVERNPEEINEHDAATIAFATEPLVVEKFVEIPELGRFVLVKNSKNIGAGVVLDATLSF